MSKGPNTFAGETLEITKGRGSIIGWYVQAKQAEEVTVSIEYACEQPLDQAREHQPHVALPLRHLHPFACRQQRRTKRVG